jgi:hypothetical protein
MRAGLANAVPHREGALLALRYGAARVAGVVHAANAAIRHDDVHHAIVHPVDPRCGIAGDPRCGIAGVVRPYFRCPRRGLLHGHAHASAHLLPAQADHLVRSFVRNLRLLMRTACKYYCADQRQSFDAHLNVHRVDFNRLASAGKTPKSKMQQGRRNETLPNNGPISS